MLAGKVVNKKMFVHMYNFIPWVVESAKCFVLGRSWVYPGDLDDPRP